VLTRLAETQHGVFAIGQAEEAGISRDTIKHRVTTGRLTRCGPSVYRFAGTPVTWRGRVAAAVLSVKGLAAASHLTAAHLWGVADRPERIEIVTARSSLIREGVIVHQSTDLQPGHTTKVDGILTTSTARTVADIGVPHGIGAAARFMDEGRRLGILDLQEAAELHHAIARKGRNGAGPARQLIAERLKWNEITESQLEDRFLRIVQRARLPRPVSQYWLKDNEVCVARLDFAYPQQRVAIELDGAAFHSDPASFRRDRERQNRIVLTGWKVLRFTWWDLLAGGAFVIDSVAEALTPN